MKVIGAVAAATLLGIILTCLVIANMCVGLVSGIWLAALGEWRYIFLGFVLTFAMPWGWMIAALPAHAIAALMIRESDIPSRAKVATLGFIAALWQASLIGLWAVLVFLLFTNHSGHVATVPLLLWGFSTMKAPLAYMASKEGPDSTGSTLGLLLAVFIYALLAVMHFAGASITAITTAVALSVVAEAAGTTALSVAMIPSGKNLNETRAQIDDLYLLDSDDGDIDDEDDEVESLFDEPIDECLNNENDEDDGEVTDEESHRPTS